MYEETLKRLKEIMVDELDLDVAEIKGDSNLTRDLDINSLEFLNVIMVIEESFGITLDENRLRVMKTVGEVVNYIVELQQK